MAKYMPHRDGNFRMHDGGPAYRRIGSCPISRVRITGISPERRQYTKALNSSSLIKGRTEHTTGRLPT
jgi:hypothetical protein